MSTLIGTGSPGYSDREVNNPYGLVIGPDRALYFCDLDNQRIRRLDLKTRGRRLSRATARRRTRGDGGPATGASLNMPHEIQFDAAGNLYIAERDNHVVRKVDAKTGVISTFAGTGAPGFSGDGGPATQAQLRQPHSIAVDPNGRLLICDIGNHRIRQVDLVQRHRSRPMAAPASGCRRRMARRVKGTPLNGPRTMAFDSRRQPLSRASRRQRDLPHRRRRPRRFIMWRAPASKAIRATAGRPASATLGGPKGLALVARHALCGRHREPCHSPHRPQDRPHHDRARHGSARGRPRARSASLRALAAAWSVRRRAPASSMWATARPTASAS